MRVTLRLAEESSEPELRRKRGFFCCSIQERMDGEAPGVPLAYCMLGERT